MWRRRVTSERGEKRQGYRNGFYVRDFVTRLGTLRLRIARAREQSFRPPGLERFQRRAEEVMLLIREAFLRGISTRQVYNFCLYRRRTDPHCFVPDPAWFPKRHQPIWPHIFSEQEIARLLIAATGLKRVPWSPLRPEVIRLALILLFTTGLRRRELLRLTLGDYDRENATLLIRESKFHKSRLLPLNGEIAEEINRYLQARARHNLSLSPSSALIGSTFKRGGDYCGRHLWRCMRQLLKQCSILTSKGRLPRLHDARHSFAVNALLRWYREGADVDAKLPLLATYLGHVSVISTYYYFHWIEPLRTAVSEKFAHHYGHVIVPIAGKRGGQR
jgi:integrase/recombinase XerD